MDYVPERSRAETFTEVLQQSTAWAEAHMHEHGWDQATTLWGLDLVGMDGDDISLGMKKLDEFSENPVDVLVGSEAPEGTVVVVMVFEGWGYPDGVREAKVPPAEHPERIEKRIALSVSQGGEWASLSRRRGAEPEFIDLGHVKGGYGLVEVALRRFARAEVRIEIPTVRQWQMQRAVLKMADAMEEHGGATEDISTQMLATLVLGFEENSIDVDRDESSEEIVAIARRRLPPPETTWADVRSQMLADTSLGAQERSWLEWLDESGVAQYLLTTTVPPGSGERILAHVAPPVRPPLRVALRELGMYFADPS